MRAAEARYVALVLAHGETLGVDYVARAMSALMRAARTTATQREILAATPAAALASHEFVLGIDRTQTRRLVCQLSPARAANLNP